LVRGGENAFAGRGIFFEHELEKREERSEGAGGEGSSCAKGICWNSDKKGDLERKWDGMKETLGIGKNLGQGNYGVARA